MSLEQVPEILIEELGSQTTLLIERSYRELGYRCVIFDPAKAKKWREKYPPKLVILSGGLHSVTDPHSPKPSEGVLETKGPDGKPAMILGICFGHQWIAHELGGRVESVPELRESGPAMMSVEAPDHAMFRGTSPRQQVWMNHGDSVIAPPRGFTITGRTDAGTITGMVRDHIWSIQHHAEVTHTTEGKQFLKNLAVAAGCVPNWKPSSLVDDIQRWTLDAVPKNARLVFGMSGGVDSTTLGAILAPVFGDRFHAITVDLGQFREGEMDEVRNHAALARMQHSVIDVSHLADSIFADTIDAEIKRKRFQPAYADPFKDLAKQVGAEYMAQGTLAPDRIETGKTGGDLIKTHHNVGLDLGLLTGIDPVGHLFKYEIRALAQEIGLPKSVWARQPFPGPGLLIRTVGLPAIRNNVAVTRWCDAQGTAILKKHGLYDDISQLVIAQFGVRTTGIKGDKRAYAGSAVVRAVETIDFMTAKGIHLPDAVEDEIAEAINKHPAIVRTWFDQTPKPPGTIEFE